MKPTRERKRTVLKKITYLINECAALRGGATPMGWMDSKMQMFQVHLSGIMTFVEDVECLEDKET